MNATRALRAAQRTPLIKFLGKRSPPKSVDHSPQPHPASPEGSLPQSFAEYRSQAQQHGPLRGGSSQATIPQRVDANAYGAIGGSTGASLGSVQPQPGQFFDRTELPARFGRLTWTESEIEVINSGGAPM